MSEYVLKLYVTGQTPRSQRAIATLKRICEEHLQGRYEIRIVDVLEWPEAAEEDRVLATPTLVKQSPPPQRRLIGDLSNQQKVILGLCLDLATNGDGVPA